MSLYSNVPEVIIWRTTSEDFLKNVVERGLDAVYIDGLHDYDNVKRDLNDAFKCTKRFILGHDYEPKRFAGVMDAVDEFCCEKNLNINVLTKDGCPSFLIKL